MMFGLLAAAAPLSTNSSSPPRDGASDVNAQVETNNVVVPVATMSRSMPSLAATTNRLGKSFPWLVVALLGAAAAIARRSNWRTSSRRHPREASLVSRLLPPRRGPPLTLA